MKAKPMESLPEQHLGRGWGVYPLVVCDMCGHEWTAVAPVGAMGVECPACGYYDPERSWGGPADEPPNDGVWLGGE